MSGSRHKSLLLWITEDIKDASRENMKWSMRHCNSGAACFILCRRMQHAQKTHVDNPAVENPLLPVPVPVQICRYASE